MVWGEILIFIVCARFAEPMNWHYLPPGVWPMWNYFTPPVVHRTSFHSEPTAMELMVDVTNSLGVAILQDHSYSRENFAFSPYGLTSVLVVLYEGACGESARQIQRTVGFPIDNEIIRVGFRDIHRHLRSYFNHEGFLSGITLNKETSTLKPTYKLILKFYGYDVNLSTDVDKKMNDENVTSPTKNGTSKSPASSTENVTTDHTTQTKLISSDEPTTPVADEESSSPDISVSTTDSDITASSKIDELMIKTDSTTEISVLTSSETLVTTDSDASTKATVQPLNSETQATTNIVATNKDENGENELVTNNVSDSETTETQSTTTLFTTAIPSEVTTANSIMSTTINGAPLKEENSNEVGSTLDNGMLIPQFSDFQSTTASSSSEPTSVKPKDQLTDSTTLEMEPHSSTLVPESLIHETVTTATQSKFDDGTTPTDFTSELESRTLTPTIFPYTGVFPKTTLLERESTEVMTTEKPTASPTSTIETETQEPVHEGMESLSTESTQFVSTVDQTTTSLENKSEETSVPTTQSESTTISYTTSGINETSTIPSELQPTTLTTPTVTDITESAVSVVDSQSTITSTMTTYLETTTYDTMTTDKKISKNLKKKRREVLKNTSNNIKISSKTTLGTSFFTTQNRLNNRSDLDTRRKRNIIEYLESPDRPDISFNFYNDMYDGYVLKNPNPFRNLQRSLFLVDGVVDVPVPMMTYTNIFNFGYIPRLRSRALEFPLDDIRYKLLILLPLERRGLRQLLYDLGRCSLREVIESIGPTRLRVTLPTFMVEGFVILTSTLQKLGIWDVFDPRRANLSAMSTDPELYVRNVEQSITVVVRNYIEILNIQMRSMAARQVIHDFEVSHPFLYFVLDSATNVALMAGQMLDPLNSRIY